MKYEKVDINSLRKDETLRLVARTQALSPPLIELFLSLVISPTISIGINRLLGAIEGAMDKWRRENELQVRLFGLSKNADILIGMRRPYDKENPWASHDLRSAQELIHSLSSVFSEKPEPMRVEKKVSPKFERNIITIGGPIPNTFSRALMGIKEPSHVSYLPYSFNLEPEKKQKGKNFEELQNEVSEPNWCIMESKTKKNMYIPEYYRRDEIQEKSRCLRDYGMIIKVRSIIEKGRVAGRKNLMVAGCHGPGTIAAAMALGDLSILERIWNEVGDKDFQAIIMCENRRGKEGLDLPIRVSLLEVCELAAFE